MERSNTQLPVATHSDPAVNPAANVFAPLATLGKAIQKRAIDLGQRLGAFFVWLPLLTAIVFVQTFATPLPLTDEWVLLKAKIAMKSADSVRAEYRAARPAFKMYDHNIVVPFAIYWAIADLVNYDNRAWVYISIGCLAVQLVIFQRGILKSSIGAFPIALVLFSPARYMDFQWGFLFTIALSIAFPIVGLAVVDRIRADDDWRHQFGKAIVAFALITLGTFSAAAGVLGFVAATVLVALSRLPLKTKSIFMIVFLCAAAAAIAAHTPSDHLPFGYRTILVLLTAAGAAIVGPGYSGDFSSFDFTSLVGLAIALATLAVAARAVALGVLSRFALPFSFIVFSTLSTVAIAINRDYLGNWHLQHVVPGVCATYASAFVLRTMDKSVYSAVPFCTLLVIFLFAPIGYYKGFTRYGPEFNSFARAVEDYARRRDEPNLKKPWVPTIPWDIDADMVRFLKSRGHPSVR